MSRRNIRNISVLNHEGELADITQAMCKHCAKVMPVKKFQTTVNYSLQKVKVETDRAFGI